MISVLGQLPKFTESPHSRPVVLRQFNSCASCLSAMFVMAGKVRLMDLLYKVHPLCLKRNAPYGKFLLRTLLAHRLKKTTHSSENKTLSCISRLKSKLTCIFFAAIKLVVHRSLAVARALHQRNVPYGKFLLQRLLAHCHKESAPRFPNHAAFVRKQNSFMCCAVAEFVYVLSEPYRPKRLSVAIFCRGAVLVLAPPAPKLGEPVDGVPYA